MLPMINNRTSQTHHLLLCENRPKSSPRTTHSDPTALFYCNTPFYLGTAAPAGHDGVEGRQGGFPTAAAAPAARLPPLPPPSPPPLRCGGGLERGRPGGALARGTVHFDCRCVIFAFFGVRCCGAGHHQLRTGKGVRWGFKGRGWFCWRCFWEALTQWVKV